MLHSIAVVFKAVIGCSAVDDVLAGSVVCHILQDLNTAFFGGVDDVICIVTLGDDSFFLLILIFCLLLDAETNLPANVDTFGLPSRPS